MNQQLFIDVDVIHLQWMMGRPNWEEVFSWELLDVFLLVRAKLKHENKNSKTLNNDRR